MQTRLLQWRSVQWSQSANGRRHHAVGKRYCSCGSLRFKDREEPKCCGKINSTFLMEIEFLLMNPICLKGMEEIFVKGLDPCVVKVF